MTDHAIEKNKTPPEPEQWLDRYGDYLFKYAMVRVSNADTAEDIVQETLVAAIQAYGRFKGDSSVKTWLVAILKRKIVDYYRRQRSRRDDNDIEAVINHVNALFDTTGHWQAAPMDWQTNPDVAYEQKEFMETLYQCLAGLPKRLADIFMMREFDELSTTVICERLDISESNSWVMLYRARMQLRICLEDKWLVGDK